MRSRKLRTAVSDRAFEIEDGTRQFFERLGPKIQRSVIWPLGDRFALLNGRTRAGVAVGSAVALVAIVLVAVLVATSGGSGGSSAPAVAVASPAPAAAAAPAPAPKPAEPTLHGAPPHFAPTKGGAGQVAAPKPAETSTPSAAPATPVAASPSPSASASASAATSKISSRPGTPAAPGSVGAEISAIPGRPAGAAAIAVAREFSDAFVVYETQGEDTEVSRTFGSTATPDLTKALLKRPPRQPADVEVPQAKILNVVPGPSRGGVFTVSVSLLRVGVTSELRLEMEKLKDEGWRVTNVLG